MIKMNSHIESVKDLFIASNQSIAAERAVAVLNPCDLEERENMENIESAVMPKPSELWRFADMIPG